MRRKAVIRHRAGHTQTPQGVYAALNKRYHWHFCVNRNCRELYHDYKCVDVAKNGRCHRCLGQQRPLMYEPRDPRPCCYGNTKVVDRAEDRIRYQLAGPGPWFQCQTCFRCHGWPCKDPNERNA